MLVTIAREFLKGDTGGVSSDSYKIQGIVRNTEIQRCFVTPPQQDVISSTSCSELTFKLNRQ